MRAKTSYVIAYTGAMLALTVLFNSLNIFFPVLSTILAYGPLNAAILITGTLVNMCLLITAWNAGLVPGLVISLLSPLTAFIMAQLTTPYIPVIAASFLGNVIFCVIAWVPYATTMTRFALTIIAALAKYGAMAALNTYVVIPMLTDEKTLEAATAALNSLFSWQQLITALLGGLLALLLAPKLPRLTI